jgi:hypothetical protein
MKYTAKIAIIASIKILLFSAAASADQVRLSGTVHMPPVCHEEQMEDYYGQMRTFTVCEDQ